MAPYRLSDITIPLLFKVALTDLDHRPWTNVDLASFLEAMAAWIQDMEGYYQNTGQKLSDVSPWRIGADALMASRMYE